MRFYLDIALENTIGGSVAHQSFLKERMQHNVIICKGALEEQLSLFVMGQIGGQGQYSILCTLEKVVVVLTSDLLEQRIRQPHSPHSLLLRLTIPKEIIEKRMKATNSADIVWQRDG